MRPGSAEAHRGLPHEGQQQEEERNDWQDVYQRAKGLIGLGQLGQRDGVGSETGQQEVCHGEIGAFEAARSDGWKLPRVGRRPGRSPASDILCKRSGVGLDWSLAVGMAAGATSRFQAAGEVPMTAE